MAASRTDQRANFVDLPDHLRPALGRNAPKLLFGYPERRTQIRLLDLPPVGVGVRPMVTDHHLTLIRDMRGHPGDELQIIHGRRGGPLLARLVTNFTLTLQKCQPLHGEHRPD